MLFARVSAAAMLLAALSICTVPTAAFADRLPSDAVVVAGIADAASTAGATELPLEQALLDGTNTDRAANGLPPLEFDSETLAIARARAADQLGQASLSHYDASGELAFVRLLNQARLQYSMAGENLARSSVAGPGVVARVEQALMQSPAHRKNILETSFSRIAIGAATDATGQVAFAEMFRGTD